MPYRNTDTPEGLEAARASRRRHYEKNKKVYIDRAKARSMDMKEWFKSLKDQPCMDCKIKYPPYVMDFDHVTGDKIDNLGTLINLGNRQKVLAEIEKCELVCSNCHRIRTHNRSSLSRPAWQLNRIRKVV